MDNSGFAKAIADSQSTSTVAALTVLESIHDRIEMWCLSLEKQPQVVGTDELRPVVETIWSLAQAASILLGVELPRPGLTNVPPI